MEHSWAKDVRPLLTPYRFEGLLAPTSVTGETRVAIDNVIDRPESKAKADEALAAYLDLLSKDIEGRREMLADLDPGLLERLEKLVAGVEIDVETDEIGETSEF